MTANTILDSYSPAYIKRYCIETLKRNEKLRLKNTALNIKVQVMQDNQERFYAKRKSIKTVRDTLAGLLLLLDQYIARLNRLDHD